MICDKFIIHAFCIESVTFRWLAGFTKGALQIALIVIIILHIPEVITIEQSPWKLNYYIILQVKI